MQVSLRKRLLGGAAVLALLAAAPFLFSSSKGTGEGKPENEQEKQQAWSMPPVKVAVATAQQGPLPMYLTGIGTLEALRQVTIQSEVDGRVAQILFKAGDSVRAGQLLVQLNDAPEQGDLLRLQAQLKNARTQLERARRLVPERALSQEQLDLAEAAYEQTAGELKRIQGLIEQKKIKAPFDGVLGIRQIHLGQFAKAGDPIVTLTNNRTMYANFTLPEQSLGSLKREQSVELSVDAHAGRKFAGRITTIEPQINTNTRTVRLQATLENPDGLLSPGMFANVSVVLPPRPDAITVPETAVTYTAYGDSVYVVQQQNGRKTPTVRQVYVKTGERRNGRVVIEEGLEAGARVVTSGQLRLSNGAAIAVTERDTLALQSEEPVRSTNARP